MVNGELGIDVENASPREPLQPYQKGDGGGSNGSQRNACPDQLHDDDGAKHLIYLSYDYYGHGGIDKIEGTQECATYDIRDMSDQYWDFVYPIVT